MYVYTKKDKFVTQHSKVVANSTQFVCKSETGCIQIGDTFRIWKKKSGLVLHVIQQQMMSGRNIQSVTCPGEEKYRNRNALLLYEDGVFEERYCDISLT